MKIENMTREELIKELTKTMIQVKKDIVTLTKTYKAGEWYHYDKDEDYIFLYSDDDPTEGVEFSWDNEYEIFEYLNY